MIAFNHIQQPEKSSLCGQSCVAMLSGKTLEGAIEAVGHRRGTYGSELIRALGFKGRLRRVTLKNGLSDLCIMSIRYTGKRGGHWAIKEFDTVLDPAYPYRVDFDVWKKIADDDGVKVKSIFDLTPFYQVVD